MTAAGTGDLGPVGDKGSQGETGAGTASGAAADGVDPGYILVLGECLADLAPAGGATEDLPPSSAAARPTGGGTVAGGTGAAPGTIIGEVGATGPSGRDRARQDLVALPGGGPANIAVGLARLGAPSTFAGRFSRGGFGPWLRRNLADNGVDLSFSVDADEPATIALVTLDSQGRASYTFYGPTTADWQWAPGELPDLGGPRRGDPAIGAVHTGSLVLALGPGAGAITAWLGHLRQKGQVLISFDPNVRPGFVEDLAVYRDRLTEVVRSSHIVRASSEDVDAVYPGTPLPAAAEKWLSLGAALVVITEGPDGATAFHQDGATVHCEPPPVDLVDTIGAGDAFTAALLAYLGDHRLLGPSSIAHLGEAQLRAALTQAVAAGSLTCSRVGADPPTRSQLDRFLADQG